MDNIDAERIMADSPFPSKQEKRERLRQMELSFKEADKDGGGNLDETEFISAMGEFYPGHSEEELRALHMQIDANCDGTVNFDMLLDFNIAKHYASKRKKNMFPLPIKIVDGGHRNKIVKIVARLADMPENNYNNSGLRKYINEEFLTVTSDGKLKIWTDRFDKHKDETIFVQTDSLHFQHKQKIKVNDLIYLKETEEVAVASNEHEVRFYEWSSEGLTMRYSIIPEAGQVTALHYWSDGKKSIFTFGDSVGYVFVCVSHHIHTCMLFNPASFSRTKQDSYKRAYMTSLLQETCQDFSVVKIKVFQDIVASMKYIPTLKEVVICGESATKMALVAVNNERTLINYSITSHKKIFSCVQYDSETQVLITGGDDGVLRAWSKEKPLCTFKMTSRKVPILYMHLRDTLFDDHLFCLHRDQTICVWDIHFQKCTQTISHEPISASIVSAVYYSIQNNEFILANTSIGVLIGKDTQLFQDFKSSHRKPLCGAIYHTIFKQVVSVCQKGDVIVWDINTGKYILKFNVSPYKLIASTAMTLNGPQRKLITVCNDNRVRFWNFNTGQELEVLPVDVPTTISGLICTEKLLFLTSTESNIIYCLKLEGKEYICIEHPLIKGGIKTIAIHPNEGCMVTVSSNGHILVWDIESLRVLYFFNNQSPRIQHVLNVHLVAEICELPEQKDVHFVKQYECKPVPLSLLNKKNDKLEARDVFKSPILHFLKSRNGHSGLATVIVADEGFISAWALTGKGGLLAKFKAIDKEAVMMCVDTDPNDQILMVGDSNGFVHVWNIENLGNRNFDFDGPFEEIGEWKVNIRPPPLLNRWNAHKGAVTSITCNPSRENFITTGFDCNVTVWTKNEHLVGSFRKGKWETKDLNPECKKQSELENEADSLL